MTARSTVRPIAAYAQEGPSIWKMNYLAPIRLALVPFYRLHPGPVVLLVIQNVMFWWVVPAAYTLVRSETRSERGRCFRGCACSLDAACSGRSSGTIFVSCSSPAPFVLWAVQGVRSRSAGLGRGRDRRDARLPARIRRHGRDVRVLAVARTRNRSTKTLRWRRTVFLIGLVWLVVRLLRLSENHGRPQHVQTSFIDQFLGPKASFPEAAGYLARNASGGNGGLGRPGVSGASGRDSRLALDLGAVQRASGRCGCSRLRNGTPSVT